MRRHLLSLACGVGLFLALAAPGAVQPPSNQSPPVITGTAQVGQTLTCTEGGWNGTAPITYSFQWKRDGSAIPGATTSTYQVTSTDAGTQMVCTVTAQNADGSASANSAAVVPVGAGSPPPAGPASDAVAPTIDDFVISRKRFRFLYLTCKNNKKTKIKPVFFTYKLSEDSNLKIVTRYAGRGAGTVKRGHHDGAMAISGKAGENKTRFGTQLHGRYYLKLGRYKATIKATDAAGNQSAIAQTEFTVLPAERSRSKKRCTVSGR